MNTDDGAGWEQQQALDQEYCELDEALSTLTSALRRNGQPEAARQLDTALRGFFGLHAESPPRTQARFDFDDSEALPF